MSDPLDWESQAVINHRIWRWEPRLGPLQDSMCPEPILDPSSYSTPPSGTPGLPSISRFGFPRPSAFLHGTLFVWELGHPQFHSHLPPVTWLSDHLFTYFDMTFCQGTISHSHPPLSNPGLFWTRFQLISRRLLWAAHRFCRGLVTLLHRCPLWSWFTFLPL